MKIITFSDSHGQHLSMQRHNRLPKGDMIICAGDCTPGGIMGDIEEFLRWFGDLDYEHKVLIAGNHDWGFERNAEKCEEMCKGYGITYLNDSGCTINGIKIWGSPVQPWFYNWAFNRARGDEIRKHWDLIPKDTQILITHGPAFGFGDLIETFGSSNNGENVGCEDLLEFIKDIKPVLHVCGHIHEGRSVIVEESNGVPTTHNNASILNEFYKSHNDMAHVFEWDKLLTGDSNGNDF